jgi:hypothetical protein
MGGYTKKRPGVYTRVIRGIMPALPDALRRDSVGARRSLAAMPAVERTPVFDELRISQTGDVWVRRYPLATDEFAHWWVFSGTGHLVASINMPKDFYLLEIGRDQLVARVTDELGVERIEIWPVSPAAPRMN